MKKKTWIILIVIAALIAVGVWFWKFRDEGTVVILQTEYPYTGTLSTSVTATGTIQPVDTVAVGTQVSGTINKVYADFNSTVKKGQLLAQLDKSLLEAQVQQIQANLQQAKANAVYQKSNFQRQEQLFKVGAISRAEYETALYQYNSGNDNVNGIIAQLSSAKRNLSFTDIYSPIDGTVLSRSVSEGQTVAASFSTPTLFSIAKDLTKMQVQASVDEADIGNVKKGQRVNFTVDAFPDDSFEGTVLDVRLKPTTSSNVVNYTTIIDAPNKDMKLKPGMTANITIYTKEVPGALIVSAKALQFQPDSVLGTIYKIEGNMLPPNDGMHRNNSAEKPGNSSAKQPDSMKQDMKAVVWVKKDSSIIAAPVTTGMKDETSVQVVSGLSERDEVVTGYEQISKTEAKKKGTASSPFMPKRPGGNNRRNNPGPPPGG
ncbi:MAG: efflux transporter periplasmic adaptor subunit [Sphingobacteriales bacterium 40-81]|nr:MAG: efflux transporter periplasmic adaptor subunit [Sphingobacteriales bacterium 40-81]